MNVVYFRFLSLFKRKLELHNLRDIVLQENMDDKLTIVFKKYIHLLGISISSSKQSVLCHKLI